MPLGALFLALSLIAAVMAFGMGRESYADKYRDAKLSGWCLAATMAVASAACAYFAWIILC